MINPTPQFLLIDDDAVNNFITRTIIKKAFQEVDIMEFTQPELGIQFLKDFQGNGPISGETFLLLDINMPMMTGWDFLKKFNELPPKYTQHFKIYILTSSINPNDLELANQNPHVIDLIQKPFSKSKLLKLVRL